MPSGRDIARGFGNTFQVAGGAATAGAPMAGAYAPALLAGGPALNLVGQGINYLAGEEQQEDPYADIRQQAIQQMQQPAPELDIGQLQNMLKQNLEQRILPGIAHRFSGLGAGGQRSSGFARTIGQAAGDQLSQLGQMVPQLQMQRYQAEQSRLGNLLGAIGGERQFGQQQEALQEQRAGRQQEMMQNLLRHAGQTFGDIEKTNLQRADIAGRQELGQQQIALREKLGQDKIAMEAARNKILAGRQGRREKAQRQRDIDQI